MRAFAVFALCGLALLPPPVVEAGPVVAPQPRMGEPLANLTIAQRGRFDIGRIRYNTPLSIANGLGPIFNKESCGNCHNNPLGGPGSQTVSRFGRSEKGTFDPLAQFGGSLLQALTISPNCQEVVPVEANVFSTRVTNGALAYGLVEAIPDADLLAVRDAQPVAQRGTAHMVPAFEDPPASPLHVGRFGWKAQVATVLTFSADASLNEMGLTNRFVMQENDPNGIRPPNLGDPDFCDGVADPEDGPDGEYFHFIDRVTDFQRFLGPPPQTPKSGMSGEVVFNSIGCAVCHHPGFTTSNSPALEDAIRNKPIRPYSDFLLHNMGLNGDPIVQGDGIEQFVKTPPLWGLRVHDPLWHDARLAAGTFAARMVAAINLHDAFASQARSAAQAFAALIQADQDKLIAFLNSLGRLEFDSDGDGDVQLDDYLNFAACFTGPGSFYTPDDACAVHDVDQDGDVDLADLDSFLLAYQGPRRDCNGNGVIDLRDILSGVSTDANHNGIPDSCEPTCDADTDGNGTVNVTDLLAVINQWGACPAVPAPCAADVNFNGVVDVNDLLAIINAWGACP